MSTLVIVNPDTGEFWSGFSWQPEYPDARKYRSLGSALRAADTVGGDVVEGYGSDQQRVAFRGVGGARKGR